MVRFYFVEEDGNSSFGLADGPVVVVTGVYAVAVVFVAEVALVGSEQLVRFEVVLTLCSLLLLILPIALPNEPWTIFELVCRRT